MIVILSPLQGIITLSPLPQNSYRSLGLLIALALALVSNSLSAAAEEPSAGEKLFALKVRPILREKCYGCHGDEADELEGGFDLRSRQSMLAGGDAFGDSVVTVGDSQSSAMLAMVAREEVDYAMPPKQAEQLTQEQVWAIRDWIDAGAPWPNDQRVGEIYDGFAEGVTVTTSGGLDAQWTKRKYKPEDLWAFQPIRTSFTANLDEREHVNLVDMFIDNRLRQRGIEAAPPPTARRSFDGQRMT